MHGPTGLAGVHVSAKKGQSAGRALAFMIFPQMQPFIIRVAVV